VKPADQEHWKFEVLNELLHALGKSPQIRESLIFKGAMILNRHLETHRKSVDIDSNLDGTFALQHADRADQKEFLEAHIRQAIIRHFEDSDPVRYELNSLRIEPKPREFHPRGWDAFEISVSLIDHRYPGVRGLPTLTIDVAAPETLSGSSIADMELDGVAIRAYTLERIAGEKARAFLSTLPTYRQKAGKPGESVRVKDLYDLGLIARSKPLTDHAFWTSAGNEFRMASESRGVDCFGLDSFFEGWPETKILYQRSPTIPKDIPVGEMEKTIAAIVAFWESIGIIPFSSPMPDKR
jgi:hypothetical protein